MAFALGRKAREAGYRLVAHDTIGSTNQDALERALAGDSGDLWVASAHQSAGRGRRGRGWETATGNLAASILTLVDDIAAIGATLGFVAGIALDDALRRVAPSLDSDIAFDAVDRGMRTGRVRLKWPNDVLVDGAKIAGILLEARPLPDGRSAVVAGMGVNVVNAPEGVPYPVTCLATLGAAVSAAGLFEALSDAWVGAARLWDGGRGFAKVRDLWLAHAAGLGERAEVKVGDDVIAGTFETIDDEGRLVMRGARGDRTTITAGEVHFGMAATVRP